MEMKVVLSRCLTSTHAFTEMIGYGLVQNLRQRNTRAQHTHTHTHFKRREKPCQIPSNFHRSPLLLPVRTANRDSNGSNNAQKSFSFARRTTKTMTTTLSTLQKMEKRRTTIKRRRRERRGRRRSNNHRYSTRKYSN